MYILRLMKPIEAIAALQKNGWTETTIAQAVGTSQPTINRIKSGSMPLFDLGIALVNLAKRDKPARARKAA